MKKFLVGFALPAAAAIAVVGSGFAVWYFGEGLNRDNGEASVNVTQAVAAGHFSFNAKATLNLDQTQTNRDAIAESTPFADYNTTDGSYTGKDFEATGVTLVDFMAPYGVSYASISAGSDIVKYDGATDADTIDHVDGKVKTTKTTYVFVPKALAEYVEVTGAASYTIGTNGYKLNSSTTLAAADYTAYSYAWGDSEDSIELKAKFTFQYIDGKEPSTLAAYKTMKAAVNGSKVVISHEAKLIKA